MLWHSAAIAVAIDRPSIQIDSEALK